MIPAWMFYSMVGLNLVLMGGWTYTITRSMNRSLQMYEFGRQNGFEQGQLAKGPQRKQKRR